MKEKWDSRYKEHETVFGTEPNAFFKAFIDSKKPGTILLPAEGEGRNALYAAQKGWQVYAFDFSEEAREKALELAKQKKVTFQYDLLDIENYKATRQYDAVALIYVHLPPAIRKKFHEEICKSLKPGGFLVLEAFAKEQLQYASGGPKDIHLLYDAPTLCNDFRFLHVISCEQKEPVLQEGTFHKGKASVLRLKGQKL